MRNQHTAVRLPGILAGFEARRPMRAAPGGRHASRFITESHVLNASRVNPRALLIAATIAIALYLIGCRIRG